MTGGAKKMAGWLWVGVFYVLVFVAGIALVGGGTVLATFAVGVLQNDAWHVIAGIALMVAGVAVFVGGVILLFRISYIPVPGQRFADNSNARTGEYVGYTDTSDGTFGGYGHHPAGGHGGGGN